MEGLRLLLLLLEMGSLSPSSALKLHLTLKKTRIKHIPVARAWSTLIVSDVDVSAIGCPSSEVGALIRRNDVGGLLSELTLFLSHLCDPSEDLVCLVVLLHLQDLRGTDEL